MVVRVWLVTLAAVLAGGCARGAYLRPGAGAVPPAEPDAVPRGTLAAAQLGQPLSTARSRVGDRFTLELLDPLADGDGREVVGRGATLEGVVRGAGPSRGAGDAAHLELEVLGVRTGGEGLVGLSAEVAAGPLSLESAWRRDVVATLTGAAVGAGAGLAIDRDRSAVVLGSTLVGAGLGALLSYVVGGREAELAAGSILTLRITEELRLSHPVARWLSPPAGQVAPREVRSGAGPGASAPSPASSRVER